MNNNNIVKIGTALKWRNTFDITKKYYQENIVTILGCVFRCRVLQAQGKSPVGFDEETGYMVYANTNVWDVIVDMAHYYNHCVDTKRLTEETLAYVKRLDEAIAGQQLEIEGLRDQLTLTNQQHQEDFANLTAQHDKDLQALNDKHAEDIANLFLLIETELAKLSEAQGKKLDELLKKHEDDLNQLIIKHDKEVTDAVAKHDRELAEVNARLSTIIEAFACFSFGEWNNDLFWSNDLAWANTPLTDVAADIAELREDLSQTIIEVAANYRLIEQNAEHISINRGDILQNSSDIADLQSDNEAQDNRISELETQFATMLEQVAEQQKHIDVFMLAFSVVSMGVWNNGLLWNNDSEWSNSGCCHCNTDFDEPITECKVKVVSYDAPTTTASLSGLSAEYDEPNESLIMLGVKAKHSQSTETLNLL